MNKKWIMTLSVCGLLMGSMAWADEPPAHQGGQQQGCNCGCDCVATAPAPRQDHHGQRPGQPHSMLNEGLIKELALSDAQVEKIKAAEESFQQKREEMRKNEENSRKEDFEARKKEMDEMMQAQQESIKAILTEDQYKSLQEIMEKHRPGPGGHGGHGGPGRMGGPEGGPHPGGPEGGPRPDGPRPEGDLGAPVPPSGSRSD